MATLTTYRGLSVLSTTPPGLGGAAINTDLIALADRFIHLATVNPTTSDKSPTYSVGNRWFNTTTNTEFVLIDDAAGTWKSLASGATTISTTAPLTGGGDLSANRTLAITAADGSNAGSMSSANFTLLTGATDANTASTIVKRDASGNFSAGTVNAATAVNVNGVGLSRAVFVQMADKTVVSTTTETSLINTSGAVGSITLPANFFTAGKSIRINAAGYQKTTGTPTLVWKVKAGATTLLTSPSNTDSVTANHCWLLRDLILTCRTTGSSGTLMGQGQIYRQDLADHGDSLELLMTTAATINTTASITLDITAQWGTSSASNSITCTTVLVESVG